MSQDTYTTPSELDHSSEEPTISVKYDRLEPQETEIKTHKKNRKSFSQLQFSYQTTTETEVSNPFRVRPTKTNMYETEFLLGDDDSATSRGASLMTEEIYLDTKNDSEEEEPEDFGQKSFPEGGRYQLPSLLVIKDNTHSLNQKYQAIMTQLNSRESQPNFNQTKQLYDRLGYLASRFTRTSLLYGEIIIKEKHLPLALKTIQPTQFVI